MNLFKAFASGINSLPAVTSSSNALTSRWTGINRFGTSGYLSLEVAPPQNNRLLKEGYLDNHIVFTVADWKAKQFAKAPPIVYEIKEDKSYRKYSALTSLQKKDSYSLRTKAIEEIDDPNDRMVKTLKQPNPLQTWAELAYAISVYYDFGNALILGVGPDKGVNAGQFHEFYMLPTALYSGEGASTEGYKYYVDNMGSNDKIPGSQVIHLRQFSPLLEAEGGGLWGMSKLAPFRRVLVKSTQAQEAEAEMFLNRGARTVLFPKHYDNMEPVTGEQARAAGEEIRKKLRQAGAGGIVANSVELGAIQLGMNSDDLKLMESNALVERQTCALWHVDTIAVFSAVTEASRANGETGVRKSLIEGVLPDQNILAQKLNQSYVPAFNRNAKYKRYLEFNTDVYPQLQTDKKDIATWLNATILSANQRNEMFGFERSDELGMDVPLVPAGFTPITDFLAPKPGDDPTNDGSY